MSFSGIVGKVVCVVPALAAGYGCVAKLNGATRNLIQSSFGSDSIHRRAETVAKDFFSKENVRELTFGHDNPEERLGNLKLSVTQYAEGFLWGAVSYVFLRQII